MSVRRPLIAGNWKMHVVGDEADAYCAELLRLLDADGVPAAELALFPPFTALERVSGALAGSDVWVGGQNVHEAESGAHTGDISVAMLAGAGCGGALVGHSERRALGETGPALAARVRAALDGGLRAMLACGESLEQREAGETEDWVTGQVREGLAEIRPDDVERFSIAYEPIWAIGTGVVATPEQAQDACALVRRVAGEFLDRDQIRVLYGGSVKPENAAELLGQPDIDGALVGGASLKPADLLAIARAA